MQNGLPACHERPSQSLLVMCADAEKMHKGFAVREAAMLQAEQEQTAEKARLAVLEKRLQVWAFLRLSSLTNGFLSIRSFSSSEQAFARLGVIVNFHVDCCLCKTHERLIPIKFSKSF